MTTDSPAASSTDGHTLPRLVLLVVVCIFVIAVYLQSYATMWGQWNRSDHSHGLAIFPIFAFLLWRCRHSLADAPLRPSLMGVIAVVVLVALWVVARLTAIEVLEHAAALALIPACFLAFFGPKLAARIAFPLAFLGFALPVSDALVPTLMQITADIATLLLRLFGIPFYREGQYLTLPGGIFVVADVCSGVRYLMVGLIVASLFAHNWFRSNARRFLFFVMAGVVLILANGFRAFLVMAIASATELKYLGGEDHIIFGWLLFGIVMFGLFWLATRFGDNAPGPALRSSEGNVSSANSRDAFLLAGVLMIGMLFMTIRPMFGEYRFLASLVGLAVLLAGIVIAIVVQGGGTASLTVQSSSQKTASVKRLIPASLAIVALFAGPALTTMALSAPDVAPGDVRFGEIAGCVGPRDWQEDWQPIMTNAAVVESASYGCDRATLSVYVAAYAKPKPGAELISSANQLFPDYWTRYQSGFSRSIDGAGMPVLEQTVTMPDDGLVTWHWYFVDGQRETAGAAVKLRQVRALLTRRPAGGHVVMIAVRAASDIEHSRELLRAAAESLQVEQS